MTHIGNQVVESVLLAGTGGGLGGLFDRIYELLWGVAVTAIAIAIIIIGFKIMFAIRNGDNVRVAIQNMGVVAFAALLIGAATGLASLLRAIGEQIGGSG